MGRKRKKTWKEMTELERLQEENKCLRTEVAYLKKLKELQERDEALQRERQKQLEKWFYVIILVLNFMGFSTILNNLFGIVEALFDY